MRKRLLKALVIDLRCCQDLFRIGKPNDGEFLRLRPFLSIIPRGQTRRMSTALALPQWVKALNRYAIVTACLRVR